MTRRSLFNFARKGDLFVSNELLGSNPSRVEGARELLEQSGLQPYPSNLKGRSRVGYSRRFFMGALAAGVYSGAGVRRFQSLYAYRVGIDRSYGEDEIVFMRSVCPGNWLEVTGHYTVNPAGVYTLTPCTLDYPLTAHLPWNTRT